MKRGLSHILLSLLFAVVAVLPQSISAAEKATSKSVSKAEQLVFSSFLNYYEMGIDEKLYLQTDKPYYSAGEQIWFKGYLRNAITHAPLDFSNFIYVELSKRTGHLVTRVKVKRDSTGFNGYITLDPKLDAGDYTLRGYTRWMAAKEPDFLFSKNIAIVSPIPPVTGSEAGIESNEPTRREQRKSGVASKSLEELDYKVQFQPEGGSLLAGVGQVLGFKALAEDGLSVEVKGGIYDASNDELITEFASTHKGMGMVPFMATAGKSYYAKVKVEKGEERKFELPASVAEGAALRVVHAAGRFMFKVETNKPSLLKNASVIIHSRGRLVSVESGDMATTRVISEEALSPGVSVLSLVSADGIVLSERVVFVKPKSMPQIDIKSGAENYKSRANASVTINVKDSSGAVATGEFGVAVTDDSSVKMDVTQDNVLSYMLLSSDIKGHIEDPGYYFAKDGAVESANLDLLMLNQGWRRFDMQGVLNKSLEMPTEGYEEGAAIRGEVKGFFGNTARKPKIFVLCSKLGYADMFELGESSRFNLKGLEIPDSTTYIIQTQGRNGGNLLTLKIDPEIFPTLNPGIFKREELHKAYVPTAFVNQSQDKFFYDGGMNMINLEAVTVTTSATSSSFGASDFATQSTGRAELENMSGQYIVDVIRTMPSMTIDSDGVMYRGGPGYARFEVDGIDSEFIDVETITADMVEQLDFYYGAEAAIFSDASGGVFTITMREGADYGGNTLPLPNIAYVDRLGYQRAAEFYQPSYENASLRQNLPPDYRTTIYWSGSQKPDADGNMTINFYTADKPTTYTITVEGVTDDGEICHSTAKLERTLL